MFRSRMNLRWVAVLTGALTLAGCSAPQAAAPSGSVLRLATVAEPTGLDPALVLDADSYRIAAQIYETLVTLAPGTTSQVVPSLAESWSSNAESTTWTFKLRQGVKFHDGTGFDAAAVKYNFDRWRNLPKALQSRAELYGSVFGGFKNQGILKSVEAPDDQTVVLTLTEPRPSLPIQLTIPVFSIASPAALKKYRADEATKGLSEFGNSHPVGTGPFVFSSWVHGNRVQLTRNENYWGEKARIKGITFRAIPDTSARVNALQAGDVDGADQINPRDIKAVKADPSLHLKLRASCNSGFVGFKSDQAPFDDPRVRQAVAHAINKQAIISRFFGETGTPAWLLMPKSVSNYDTSLTNPAYDPDLARKLLAQSGDPTPSVAFWYPTDVTRPWLPDSQGIFQAIAADLKAVGFQITPKSATWTSYLGDSQRPDYQMFLFGWSCDYGAADNFYGGALGYVDGKPNPRYGYASEAFATALAAATAAPKDRQQAAWQKVQQIVHRDLPVVPFVHGSSAMAFSNRVHGYVPNPVLVEHMDDVRMGK
ncbi:ABC transporter substrate-binding protein [Spirillospora sp. CA-255316]